MVCSTPGRRVPFDWVGLLLIAIIAFSRLGSSSTSAGDAAGISRAGAGEESTIPTGWDPGRAALAYSAVHANYEPDEAAGTATITDCVISNSVFQVLHTFPGGINGSVPETSLIQAADGDFYGMTGRGGLFDVGVIFRMTPEGFGYTILHTFAGGEDGAHPYGSLIQAADGNFYGTTAAGGSTSCSLGADCGTVFRMTPDGSVSVLHAFTGGSDGAVPSAALVQGADGNFYGTTEFGGGAGCFGGGCGTVFKMTPDGEVTVLYSFSARNGVFPVTPLIQADDGNFYGTTMGVNSSTLRSSPTAFQITPEGAIRVLHYFPLGFPDEGRSRPSGLIQASDGSFYGTTTGAGGPVDFSGTVFRIARDGTYTQLHSFGGPRDGAFPLGGLVQAIDGNFYGTTYSGGGGAECPSCGSIFEMTPHGTVTVLHPFNGHEGGSGPAAALVEATDGSFYGTASFAGAAFQGIVFRLELVYGLAATPETVNPGDPLTVTWDAPPGRSPTDWIGLYPVDAPNTDPVWWQYTHGGCGSITIGAPDVSGQYEFRYLLNDGFVDVKRSNTVTVK